MDDLELKTNIEDTSSFATSEEISMSDDDLLQELIDNLKNFIIPSEISSNHPDYDCNYNDIQIMRDSMMGEEYIRSTCVEKRYLCIPPGIRPENSENDIQRQIDYDNMLGYIYRASYPEIVQRTIEFAIATAFSSPYEIHNRPEEFTDDFLNSLDSTGRSFDELLRKITEESLISRGGAIVTDRKRDGEPNIIVYDWESCPNRSYDGDGNIQFAIFEELNQSSDSFLSHEKHTERVIIFKNPYDSRDQNIYTQRFRSSGEKKNYKSLYGKYRIDKYFNDKNNLSNSSSFTPLTDIASIDVPSFPVIYLSSPQYRRSIFLPLAKAALSYFQASANLENALFHTANPVPYINFKEGGNFYDAEAPGQEEDTSTLILRKGATRPLIFKDGTYAYAQTGDNGVSFLMKKLEFEVEKIASLGAKAFSNKQATNVSAETQRIQTFSENAIVSLVINEVESSITSMLRKIATMKRIDGANDIAFKFPRSNGLDDFTVEDFKDLLELYKEGIIPKSIVRDHARRTKFISENISDEEINSQLEKDSAVEIGLDMDN